jgi:putative membrane protein insertion efficiency factor
MFRALFLAVIRFYRRGISPFTPPACRFSPTCSEYAREAIEKYGAGKGGWMALRRLFRCHPFGGKGFDPVP